MERVTIETDKIHKPVGPYVHFGRVVRVPWRGRAKGRHQRGGEPRFRDATG